MQFNRIMVGNDGRLSVEPYLGIKCAGSNDWQDLRTAFAVSCRISRTRMDRWISLSAGTRRIANKRSRLYA